MASWLEQHEAARQQAGKERQRARIRSEGCHNEGQGGGGTHVMTGRSRMVIEPRGGMFRLIYLIEMREARLDYASYSYRFSASFPPVRIGTSALPGRHKVIPHTVVFR